MRSFVNGGLAVNCRHWDDFDIGITVLQNIVNKHPIAIDITPKVTYYVRKAFHSTQNEDYSTPIVKDYAPRAKIMHQWQNPLRFCEVLCALADSLEICAIKLSFFSGSDGKELKGVDWY